MLCLAEQALDTQTGVAARQEVGRIVSGSDGVATDLYKPERASGFTFME